MTEQAGFTTAGHGPSAKTSNTSSSTTATVTIPPAHAHHRDYHDRQHDYPENHDDAPSLSLHHLHRQNHSSSKLPAFRFADFKPGAAPAPASLTPPSLTHIAPPSPVSPASLPDGPQSPPEPPAEKEPQPAPTTVCQTEGLPTPAADDSPIQLVSRRVPSAHHHTTPATSTSPPANTAPTATAPKSVDPLLTQTRRPISYPENSSADLASPPNPPSTDAAARLQARRAATSRSFSTSSLTAGSALAINTHRLHAVGAEISPEKSAKSSPSGQRELLLPKTLSQTTSPDERRASSHRPPPVSYKPPMNAAVTSPLSPSTPVRVPPIRAFRSSGSRKSLGLEGVNFNTRPYDTDDDVPDTNHDRTLRALEGRFDPDLTLMSPPMSAGPSSSVRPEAAADGEDTTDVFLKIAREEDSTRRNVDGNAAAETQSAVSRVRSTHRRPLSTTVASYHPTSPPQLSRRLSDQQDTSRLRKYEEERASDVSKITTYRSLAREKVASIFPGEDLIRARPVGSALRPSPLTPRSVAPSEPGADSSTRRKPSITDSSTILTPRTSAYKPMAVSHSHSKSHGSSPLVKSIDSQVQQTVETPQGLEGTESSTSTAAPSTVWDELDDLKSRIHRLELTGKLPATSGAAMSRVSDERPPTATTTVTTVSSSPKRSGAGAVQPTEVASTTSSQREAQHPLLVSVLAKSKPFLNPEVFRALESAANDAMALSSMMGSPGQPGPISSGVSTVASGGTVTDRQLRRKADSVCRSLTELCVALGEDVSNSRPAQVVSTPQAIQNEGPTTPTVNKSLSSVAVQRRKSIVGEPEPSKLLTSPRAMSKFEERRNNILSGTTLPSPRVINSVPSTPNDTTPNRRSSLLIARSRRAGTEEPEDGRKSSILRTRRAGTEEPDEGRKTSLLVRGRRGTVGEGDDESRFRAPSRAITEVQGFQNHAREYQSQSQAQPRSSVETVTQVSTTVPRRRFASSGIQPSRLVTPSTPGLASPKRYLERSSIDREVANTVENITEERSYRNPSISQTMMLSRTGSLNTRRQNRDSTYAPVSTTATTGAYR